MSFSSIHNNSSSITLSSISSSSSSQSHTNYIFSRSPRPSSLSLPRVPPSNSIVSLARRRSNPGRPITSSKNKSQKKSNSHEGDDLNEDAFEALFKQLEEDLKQDEELLNDGEDEISEEELAMLERELEEALAEDENMSELVKMTENVAVEGEVEEEMEDEVSEAVVDDEEEEDEDEDEEDEEEPVKLKGWQLRRLAYALKVGRRKTSIKNLAAELCLDRAIVLELLREPPPDLLMMSATLPDKPENPITIPESKELTSVPSKVIADAARPEPKVKTPVHVLQGNWSAQKRLKKVHVETLEKVYRRTKRPTNTMISSIVHVTNLPRAKVVKWFEDKRAGEGEPEQHRPYRRSSSKSVSVQ
ncbi:Protein OVEREXPRESSOR OF CATIONIC PEROXIDASE 3 [Bienertia sinuspersici]